MTGLGTHDVVVVGAGTAGIATAVTLAEAGVDVCLIEAGPSDRDYPNVRDIRRWQESLLTELDYAVAVEHPESLVYSAGRVLGGGSSLNNAWAFELPDYDV